MRNIGVVAVSVPLILLGLMLSTAAAAPAEYYIELKLDKPNQFAQISKVVSVGKVEGDLVWAYGDEKALEVLRELKYTFRILPHPGSLHTPRMGSSLKDMQNWDYYPTYGDYVDMMVAFGADPICDFYDKGDAANPTHNRDILFVKISDNPGQEENEPEIMLSSTIHGNETLGYILMLRLIDSLLVGYEEEVEGVVELVENCEIWINPLANPDGLYRDNDATIENPIRWNYPGPGTDAVDLNRNFPDVACPDWDECNDRAPETQALMNLAESESFTLAASFHAGIELVVYPYDGNWNCGADLCDPMDYDPWEYPDYRWHVDNDWFVDIAEEYALSAQDDGPSGFFDDDPDGNGPQMPGTTHGATQYWIRGGSQDYMTYSQHCREVIIELSSTFVMDADSLNLCWEYHREALFDFMRNAMYGFHGLVADSGSDEPLYAMIEVVDHDLEADSSYVYTDPDVGDFHRMIMPTDPEESYTVRCSAPGYRPKVVTGVEVTAGQATVLDPILLVLCGDVNWDGSVNAADISYLQAYIFFSGPAPPVLEAADANCDDGVNVGDLVYLVNYVLKSGPEPCAWCD